MVIIYDLETKEILSTEDNTIIPELPFGDTDEKVRMLKEEGKGFVSMPYEYGPDILNYELIFDEQDRFVGLQPKEKGEDA